MLIIDQLLGSHWVDVVHWCGGSTQACLCYFLPLLRSGFAPKHSPFTIIRDYHRRSVLLTTGSFVHSLEDAMRLPACLHVSHPDIGLSCRLKRFADSNILASYSADRGSYLEGPQNTGWRSQLFLNDFR